MFKRIFKVLNIKNDKIPINEKQINDNKNIEEILKPIEEGNLQELHKAFLLLLSNNDELKQRIAKIINIGLKKYSSEQLIKLDILFRERTSLEWSYDWQNKSPSSMLLPTMTEEEKIMILGLCSFNPNGYFREKAIKLLSEYKNNSVIPYIIIRLNDWVYPVRIVAKDALNKRLILNNAKDIIDNLTLIYRLKNCKRDTYEEIISKVNNLLTSKDCCDVLFNGLKSENPKVRQYCYEIVINSGVADNSTLVEYITKERLEFIRVKVIRYVISSSSVEEVKLFYKELLKDKSSKVKIAVLYAVYKYDFEEVIKELECSLLDRSSSIRETARVLLGKKGVHNIAEFYRKAIINEDSLVGAVYGLGETGTIEDCKYIEKYINTESTKFLRAVMVSLFRLNYEKYRELFIEKVKDVRVSISKQAKTILYNKIDVSDEELIYQIYKETEYSHVRINTVLLFFQLSKWDSIKYILEFNGNNDEKVLNLAKNALNKWIERFNKSFIKPSKVQKLLIKQAIDKNEGFVDKKFIDFIKYSIE